MSDSFFSLGGPFILADALLALLSCLFLLFLLLVILFPVVDNVEQVVDRTVPLFPRLVNRVLKLDGGFLLTDVEEKSSLDEGNGFFIELSQVSNEH